MSEWDTVDEQRSNNVKIIRPFCSVEVARTEARATLDEQSAQGIPLQDDLAARVHLSDTIPTSSCSLP
jgi:hypothetical protein